MLGSPARAALPAVALPAALAPSQKKKRTISNVRQAKVGVYQSTALQMLMMVLMSGIGLSIYAYYASAGTATWNFHF